MNIIVSDSFIDAYQNIAVELQDVINTLIKDNGTHIIPRQTKVCRTCFKRLPYIFKMNICRGVWLIFSTARVITSKSKIIRFWALETNVTAAMPPRGGPFLGTNLKEVERFTRWQFDSCPANYLIKEKAGSWLEGLRWYHFEDPANPVLVQDRLRPAPLGQHQLFLGRSGSGLTTLALTRFIEESNHRQAILLAPSLEAAERLRKHAKLLGWKAQATAVINDVNSFLCAFQTELGFEPERQMDALRFREAWLQGPFPQTDSQSVWLERIHTFKGNLLPFPSAFIERLLNLPMPFPHSDQWALRQILAQWGRTLPAQSDPAPPAGLANHGSIGPTEQEQAEFKAWLNRLRGTWSESEVQTRSAPVPPPLAPDHTTLLGDGFANALAWYQAYCRQWGYWDSQDLALALVNHLLAVPQPLANTALLVDDAQQLSPLQRLALVLCAGPDTQLTLCLGEELWLSGTQQREELDLVSPGLARTISLGQVRATSPVAWLRSLCADWIRRVSGHPATTQTRPNFHSGRLVALARGINEQAILALAPALTPHDAILVRSDHIAQRLRTLWGNDRIYSLAETEGRLFHTVVLLQFFEDGLSEDWLTWETQGTATPRLVDTFKAIYKGLARARYDAVLHEGPEPLAIAQTSPFKEWLAIVSETSLLKRFFHPVLFEKDWLALGDSYAQANLSLAAEAAYRQANDSHAAEIQRACFLQQEGHYEEAAMVFRKNGQLERAAQCFEQADDPQSALMLWNRLKDQQGTVRCRLTILVQEGRFEVAARVYERQSDFRNTVLMYRRAGAFRKAAIVAQQRLFDDREAAALYELGEDWALAARLWEKLDEPTRAYSLYLRAQEPAHAQRILEQQGDKEGLKALYKELGRSPKLLAYFEKNQNTEACIEMLQHWPKADMEREARKALKQKKYYPAYIRFLALNDQAGIAETAFRLKMFELAGDTYLSLGQYHEAGDAYRRCELWKQSFLAHFEAADAPPLFTRARRLIGKVKDRAWINELAFQCLEKEAYHQARFLFRKLDRLLQLGECLLALGQNEEALAAWSDMSDALSLEYAIKVCLKFDQLEIGVKLIVDLVPCFQDWRKGLFSPDKTPAIFECTTRYFRKVDDPKRRLDWATRLLKRDHLGVNCHHAFTLFEMGNHFNDCLELLHGWQEREPVWSQVLTAFRNDLSQSDHKGTLPGRAIRHYCLGDTEALEATLSHLKIDAVNALVFLLDRCTLAEIYPLLASQTDYKPVPATLNQALYLAQRAEAVRQPGLASYFYLKADQAESALDQAKSAASHLLQGAAYLAQAEFALASEHFLQVEPPPHDLLAQAFEALEAYDEAMNHFGLAGDGAGTARCRRKKRQLEEG